MSLKVIELNDNALRVGDESGILIESPGFALAVDKQLQLGDVAKQQSRIQPSHSYNRYLHELSLDPINHAVGFRHAADIAYAHLLHLAEEAGVDEDVIFAVPGNFARQQLAILLGLAKQSPFQVVGMVDSALAAAHAATHAGSLIYAEMQLHQVVLTKIAVKEDSLQRESVIQVPGVGSQNFMDLMMQLATSLFIEQCRFNPQHEAKSEQQLYNALPLWLENDDKSQNSLLLELKTNTAVYTAKMPRESLINNLSRHYKSIGQQVAQLAAGGDSKLLLSPDFADLPGFRSSLGESIELEVLPIDAISRAVILNRDSIVNSDDHIQLITSLPRVAASIKAGSQTDSIAVQSERELATHVLVGSTAIPLGTVNLPELGKIEKYEDGFYLDSGKQEFLLNQHKLVGKHALSLGDLIQSSEDSEVIRLIQVSNV
tara:strand:+ start:23827 stop:25116 length:1290 start_codon:yes stop_codon:yes gene_type:complete